MAKTVNTNSKRKSPPARTPEERENQLISRAVDLAEKQLMEGTASSQVITHFLKLGTARERLEREMLQKQMDHITAKIDAIKAAEQRDELYAEAIRAMQRYSGNYDGEEDDESE